MNLWEVNIDTIKKSIETVINISKDVSLEIEVVKIKYMLLSHHHLHLSATISFKVWKIQYVTKQRTRHIYV
jgi:hypothetical protein